jgi:ferredoxin--NADP+ reductase
MAALSYTPQEIPSNLYKPKEPFTATVLENTKITGDSSPNDVRHLVFNIEGSNLWYLDGQSLGVLPPGEANGKAHKLRLYSIASPSNGDDGHNKTITLCVKRLVYENEAGETVKGVCSNFLCDLEPGQTVNVTGPVGKSFLLPNEANTNLIMVATGTGIAPFRAFLKTRYERERRNDNGQTHLFFGAQYNSDFLYQNELETFQQNDSFHLHTAFSREQQNAAGQRLYVQHRLAEQADTILSLLEQPNTYFYICGLKGMEGGILEALQKSAAAKGVDWAELYTLLQNQKRWHIEVY